MKRGDMWRYYTLIAVTLLSMGTLCASVDALQVEETLELVSTYLEEGKFIIESSETISEVKVYDLSGRMILSDAPKDSKQVLYLTSAVSGMYIIEVMYASGNLSRNSVVFE